MKTAVEFRGVTGAKRQKKKGTQNCKINCFAALGNYFASLSPNLMVLKAMKLLR